MEYISLNVNFIIRVNLISQGIKESRRCEEEREKNGVVFQVGLQPSLCLSIYPLENVFKG